MTRISIFDFKRADFLVYGLAAGLSRAGGLLAVPVAAHALSLAEIGIYAMGMVLVQVLSQVLSMGGGAAVSREGAINATSARALATQFSLIALVLSALASAFASLFSLQLYWVVFIYLAAHEATQQLMQLVLRAEDRPITFLIFSVTKTFAWVFLAIAFIRIVPFDNWSIETWLALQLSVYSLVSISVVVFRSDRRIVKPEPTETILHHLPYCLPLIVHGLAQWALNSSDKLVVGAILGNEKLAVYSLAYTVASVMAVLLSGLGLYLPHEIMKHAEKWSSPDFRYGFIKKYTLGYTVIFLLLLGCFAIDYRYIGLLKYYHFLMPSVIGIVAAGYLFLGIYQVYVCFLFAAKETKKITKITLLVSVAYFVLVAPLVFLFGIVGAAAATAIAYALYMQIIRKAAIELVQHEQTYLNRETRIASYSAAICVVAGATLSYVFNFN